MRISYPKTDPLLSSSMQRASFKCETPRLELKSSRSFLAIKRCQRTKIGKVIKLARSSKKSGRISATIVVNSLTAISCYGGEKHQNPVGFYSRNSTESTLQDKHNNHKHHHHGGAVCPSFGVGSMDPPDRTHVTSSEEVGRGGWCKRFN